MTDNTDALAVSAARMTEVYDDALFAEDKATGSGQPGFARRSALRAMHSLAVELTALRPSPTRDAVADGEGVERAWPDIGVEPLTLPRPRDIKETKARVRAAMVTQQPHVPNGTALVWRTDLLDLHHRAIRFEAMAETRTANTGRAEVLEDTFRVEHGSANSHVFEDAIYLEGADECIAFSNEPWTSRIVAALSPLPPEQGADDGWEPIETAPKARGILVGCWVDGEWSQWFAQHEGGTWPWGNDGTYGDEPTHWHEPVSAPPTTEGETR